MSASARFAAKLPGAVGVLPAISTLVFALMLLGGLWLTLWQQRWRYGDWLHLRRVCAGAVCRPARCLDRAGWPARRGTRCHRRTRCALGAAITVRVEELAGARRGLPRTCASHAWRFRGLPVPWPTIAGAPISWSFRCRRRKDAMDLTVWWTFSMCGLLARMRSTSMARISLKLQWSRGLAVCCRGHRRRRGWGHDERSVQQTGVSGLRGARDPKIAQGCGRRVLDIMRRHWICSMRCACRGLR